MSDRFLTALLCGYLFIGILLGFVMSALFLEPEQPRLVGYGCEDSRGPLYAYEEDHFPVCDAIEGL